jgi:nicotinate-nucleotide adenylyltransferase
MTDARAAAPASIGVFGGTFDPVHFGHLRTAYEVMQAVPLAEVRFIPAADPPHRAAPLAPAQQRLALVRAAVADQPGFVVDDRELRRAGPSYSVLTLGELRAEYPDVPVCLIMGMDAFQGLPTWHRWQELLELAHVVVAPRPGWTEPATGLLADLLAARRAPGRRALLQRAAGYVHVEPVTQLEISSSELRELLAAGRDPRYLVPDAVRAELRRTQCYSLPRPTR